ncbi:hypothetical protein PM038_17475 [Halorubrum ezzemoulense]|uniref:hypothetical protein n=1 Tax=Halorubrum ezzemoulense TaxID=337243 RepID=UPI00232CCE87|nr:hypothetical protein [Halorubrum ezzemoulense]MDB2287012.1 hypothetical protein [Halorubrum ezzemoulense]
MGVTGVVTHPLVSGTDDDQESRLKARDLLVPETVVSDRFSQYADLGSGRFFEILTEEVTALTDADTATNGYWDGGTQDNPHWTVSSMATVADDTLSRGVVEAAAGQSYDEYVADYDAETRSSIAFEQSSTRTDRGAEWQMNMLQTYGDDSDATVIRYTDRMRIQFFDNVLLGTIVFGPRQEPPELATMLEAFTTQQHAQYRAHTATP